MTAPSIAAEVCVLLRCSSDDFTRGGATESVMHTLDVEVFGEDEKLALEVDGVPEQRLVEELPSNRADEALVRRKDEIRACRGRS